MSPKSLVTTASSVVSVADDHGDQVSDASPYNAVKGPWWNTLQQSPAQLRIKDVTRGWRNGGVSVTKKKVETSAFL